jgi:hypothetical protein
MELIGSETQEVIRMLYVTMDLRFLTNQRDANRPFGRRECTYYEQGSADVWREGSRRRNGRHRRDYFSFRHKA